MHGHLQAAANKAPPTEASGATGGTKAADATDVAHSEASGDGGDKGITEAAKDGRKGAAKKNSAPTPIAADAAKVSSKGRSTKEAPTNLSGDDEGPKLHAAAPMPAAADATDTPLKEASGAKGSKGAAGAATPASTAAAGAATPMTVDERVHNMPLAAESGLANDDDIGDGQAAANNARCSEASGDGGDKGISGVAKDGRKGSTVDEPDPKGGYNMPSAAESGLENDDALIIPTIPTKSTGAAPTPMSDAKPAKAKVPRNVDLAAIDDSFPALVKDVCDSNDCGKIMELLGQLQKKPIFMNDCSWKEMQRELSGPAEELVNTLVRDAAQFSSDGDNLVQDSCRLISFCTNAMVWLKEIGLKDLSMYRTLQQTRALSFCVLGWFKQAVADATAVIDELAGGAMDGIEANARACEAVALLKMGQVPLAKKTIQGMTAQPAMAVTECIDKVHARFKERLGEAAAVQIMRDIGDPNSDTMESVLKQFEGESESILMALEEVLGLLDELPFTDLPFELCHCRACKGAACKWSIFHEMKLRVLWKNEHFRGARTMLERTAEVNALCTGGAFVEDIAANKPYLQDTVLEIDALRQATLSATNHSCDEKTEMLGGPAVITAVSFLPLKVVKVFVRCLIFGDDLKTAKEALLLLMRQHNSEEAQSQGLANWARMEFQNLEKATTFLQHGDFFYHSEKWTQALEACKNCQTLQWQSVTELKFGPSVTLGKLESFCLVGRANVKLGAVTAALCDCDNDKETHLNLALQFCNMALEAEPNNLEAGMTKGCVFCQQRLWEQATSAFVDCLTMLHQGFAEASNEEQKTIITNALEIVDAELRHLRGEPQYTREGCLSLLLLVGLEDCVSCDAACKALRKRKALVSPDHLKNQGRTHKEQLVDLSTFFNGFTEILVSWKANIQLNCG